MNLRPSGYEHPEGVSQALPNLHNPSQSLQDAADTPADSVQPLPGLRKDSGPPVVRAPMPADVNGQDRAATLASLLNVTQVARHLGVSAATVYGLCDRNELAHVRVANAIRVAPGDVEAFVRAASGARTKRRPKTLAAAAEPTVATPGPTGAPREPRRAEPDGQAEAQGSSSHHPDQAASHSADGAAQ